MPLIHRDHLVENSIEAIREAADEARNSREVGIEFSPKHFQPASVLLDPVRKKCLGCGVPEWLHAGRLGREFSDFGKGRSAKRIVFLEGMEGPPDQPGFAVQADFGTGTPRGHCIGQRAALRLRSKAIFAQTVAQQPANRCLAAVADLSAARAVARRPGAAPPAPAQA